MIYRTVICFLLMLLSAPIEAQDLNYGIIPNPRAIKKGHLSTVEKISDIDRHFKPEWIREYIYVDLSTVCAGENITARGYSHILTEEQRTVLVSGDTGSDIDITIHYYPENNLPKEAKEIRINYEIAPDIDAQYPDGKSELQAYLKKAIITPLTDTDESDIFQGRVSFAITSDGRPTQVETLERSSSPKVDQLLLSAIEEMPPWVPGTNADGTPVPQSFELVLTRDGCYYSILR